MDSKNTKLYSTILLLILLFLGVLAYYFLFYKKKFKEDKQDLTIFQSLKEDPEYLLRENLLTIKGENLLEYFRLRKNYHSYIPNAKADKGVIEELEIEFPSEKGKVLIELYKVYNQFEEQKKETWNNQELDSYTKLKKIEMLKQEIFGERLTELLFPTKDSELIQTFYSYADRYLKKHYTDLPKSKKNHLEKARIEIYGDEFERLFSLEPAKKRLELEIKIHERELSILNPEERKLAVEEFKQKLMEYSR